MSRRIAILTHSTNPRGGVVHAMNLAEALCEEGEEAVLVAPALPGQSFFRAPRCPSMLIPAAPAANTAEMVARRIAEIAGFLREADFALYHAQDPIGANALADLKDDGRIGGFVRTVHHLDDFADPRLAAWQERGWRAASQLLCVSEVWRQRLAMLAGRPVLKIGNGVDLRRFRPDPTAEDGAVRQRLGLPDAPFLLCFGGIEARKNTLGVLRAFLALRVKRPDVALVIAGGASLLDHRAAQTAFAAILAQASENDRAAIRVLGVVADEEMPALYRAAQALVAPSLMEGFGLCPIEAMACGKPAIVSARPPFTEHLAAEEVLWAEPEDTAAIARAMDAALDPITAAMLGARGPAVAARFRWQSVARDHRTIYAALAEELPTHA